jgi:hypothetical protein
MFEIETRFHRPVEGRDRKTDQCNYIPAIMNVIKSRSRSVGHANDRSAPFDFAQGAYIKIGNCNRQNLPGRDTIDNQV